MISIETIGGMFVACAHKFANYDDCVNLIVEDGTAHVTFKNFHAKNVNDSLKDVIYCILYQIYNPERIGIFGYKVEKQALSTMITFRCVLPSTDVVYTKIWIAFQEDQVTFSIHVDK